MNKEELHQWYSLREQLINGWHLSKQDMQELIRLNYGVMEMANKIHNDHMLAKSW